MVKFYVRTRGLRVDYSFLPEQFTVGDLKDYKSDLEKPTCILERTENNGFFLLLTGIPSQRKDHQGTRIRYDLVATDDSEIWNDDDNEKKGLVKLIWLWLNDVKSGLYAIQKDDNTIESMRLPSVEKSEIGKRLDKILLEDYLEGLLERVNEGGCGEGDKDEFNNKLKALVLQIPQQFVLEPESNYNFWWGGVNNDFSCRRWITLVEKILVGNISGKALLLNIATPQSLGRLTRGNKELGVLLAKEWSRNKPSVIKIQLDTNVEILKKNPRITLPATKMAFFIIIGGVVLFCLGFFFGTKQFHLGNRIEEEMLSWSESVRKNKGLLLEINGRIKGSERESVDSICVLSISNGRFFYLDAKERTKGNSCQGKSLVPVQNDGSWRFANPFGNQKRRVIRVEKIYRDNKGVESRSYVDFTIGQS
ncbi:hypothetical protein RIVM261_041120 [Rivularia sp. IAM M-261]|nr:hypothetical protein RIVM261_041120 [Rivularia sp. IAM M-261]